MPAPLERIYGRPGFLLKRCHQVAAAIFMQRCAGCNLTPSQYGALGALREFPGIDQLAVGRLIGLDRSTAGLVVKLLAERGLIERSVSPHDKRRMQLRLSPQGESLLARAEPAAKRAQQDVLAALPKAKQARLLALLEDFLRGHEAVIDPASIMTGKPFGSQFDALINGKEGAPPAKRTAETRRQRRGDAAPG